MLKLIWLCPFCGLFYLLILSIKTAVVSIAAFINLSEFDKEKDR